MSDDLILSGAGSTAVASDELLENARRLQSLAGQLADWQARVAGLMADTRTAAPTWSGQDAEPHLMQARAALRRANTLSTNLAGSLSSAAERYGLAERTVAGVLQLWSAHFAFVLGRLAPFILLTQMPALVGGAVGALLGLMWGSSPQGLTRVSEDLARRKAVLSNPAFIQMVRYAVSSADDGMLGALGMPYPLNHVLGDEGFGVLGVGSSAYVASRLSPGSLLAETPVRVTRTGTSSVMPPVSFRDVAERVPDLVAGSSQVRIERYDGAGAGAGAGAGPGAGPGPTSGHGTLQRRPSWVVYVGGTIDASLQASDEPWDMTSNVNGIAGVDSGSYLATMQAMREAGIQPHDALIMVGHSQGGIVASRVVASGEFGSGDQPTGLLTFGSPSGQIPVPDHVVSVGVEHTDDLIPALGGVSSARSDGVPERLLVRRMVYNDRPLPADEWIPAHSMSNYSDTAALMDASTDPRIRDFSDLLGSMGGSALGGSVAAGAMTGSAVTGIATAFRGDRMSPAPVAAAPTIGAAARAGSTTSGSGGGR